MAQINERVKRSIDSLQRLYSIVIGLAITEALRRFLFPTNPPATAATPISSALPLSTNVELLLMLFVTVVPIYHGANAHLDETYLYGKDADKQKRYALLVDFAMLFAEAIVLLTLALSLNDFARFVRAFEGLLLLDIAWSVCVYFLAPQSTNSRHAMNWGLLNVGALVCIALVSDTNFLMDEARPHWVLGIAILRTAADYRINWPLYSGYLLPEGEKRAETTETGLP